MRFDLNLSLVGVANYSIRFVFPFDERFLSSCCIKHALNTLHNNNIVKRGIRFMWLSEITFDYLESLGAFGDKSFFFDK
jgi:hypothetical protein